MCLVSVQQTDNSTTNSTSNGTLPGVLPGERLVVTSTGLNTNGTSAVNVTGESAYDMITSIEDDAEGSNITDPYKRLVRYSRVLVLLRGFCSRVFVFR